MGLNLRPHPGDVVADIGVGTGVLSLAAAMRGAREVWGTDVMGSAITAANLNAVRNRVKDRCHFVEGSYFHNLPSKLRFNLIVSNPPSTPSVAGTKGNPAIDGGETGSDKLLEIVDQARSRLIREGRILVPLAGWTSPRETLKKLASTFRMKTVTRVRCRLDGANVGLRGSLDELARMGIVEFHRDNEGEPIFTHELLELRLK